MSRGHVQARVSEQIRTLFQAGSLGGLTDAQLLERYLSPEGPGSETAFAALVERHGPMVLGVCRRLLLDTHLAEDAFQATFLVLARRANSVRNHDSLGGWLHRVARRIAMRLRSTTERKKARERAGTNPETFAVEYADRVASDELRSVIDHEIDQLAESNRLPVVLCCLEGISHEEASQRLRWPLGTVKSRLARGRKRLQERLLRRGFAPSVAIGAGAGLLAAGEASAAVPPALLDATTKAAAAIAAGSSITGVVPASLAALAQTEVSAMLATKLKLATGIPGAAALAAILVGFVLTGAANQKVIPTLTLAAAIPARDEPQGQAEAPNPAARLSATGTVVDELGRPITNARVILREWSEFRVRGRPPAEMEELVRGAGVNDILAETSTDAAGRFRFVSIPAPAFPNVPEADRAYPWDIVALAPGRGLAWIQLAREHRHTAITLKLGPEGIIRGRLVEPNGKPIAGAKVRVSGIDPLGRLNENGLGTENRLNLSWSAFPLGATTDADGRYTIGGLTRDKIVTIIVTEPGHERLYKFAATTDVPQPDIVSQFSRGTKGEPVRWPIRTGDFVLTAKTANHVLVGRVVSEADGKPVAQARILRGGFWSRADENGRFRIDGLVSGNLELHASAAGPESEAAPLDVSIEIPETPLQIERTLTLPRGLVVTGRVVDGSSRNGVAKALVQFTPRHDAGQIPTGFGFQQRETDADGRFRMVVPPGRGTVVLETYPVDFPQPIRRPYGQPPKPELSREVEGRGGQMITVPDFKLHRGSEVLLRVVDGARKPLGGARIDVRDPNRLPLNSPTGRSDPEGRYKVVGLAPARDTIVDIIDHQQSLGATIEIPGAPAGAEGAELEVPLQPLVSLSGRVLDDEGKPLRNAAVSLFRDVNHPEQSGWFFGVSIATMNDVNDDGTYPFTGLIPGATYYTQVEVTGYPHATSEHVRLRPSESVRLKDFRLPAVDQEVTGVVVDPRGKPLAGIMVSYERNDENRAFYAPRGGTWFEDTDEAGRFHLTGLPRRPIRLMVYRNPKTPFTQIKGIKYAEARPGQTDVRIVMPDAN
jgi:RNA polymerase sigma factor (sigma-70 family)